MTYSHITSLLRSSFEKDFSKTRFLCHHLQQQAIAMPFLAYRSTKHCSQYLSGKHLTQWEFLVFKRARLCRSNNAPWKQEHKYEPPGLLHLGAVLQEMQGNQFCCLLPEGQSAADGRRGAHPSLTGFISLFPSHSSCCGDNAQIPMRSGLKCGLGAAHPAFRHTETLPSRSASDYKAAQLIKMYSAVSYFGKTSVDHLEGQYTSTSELSDCSKFLLLLLLHVQMRH